MLIASALTTKVQPLRRERLYKGVKAFWCLYCQFGKHFAVDKNVFLFQNCSELAPSGAVIAESSIGALEPEGALVAFPVLAVAVGVLVSVEQGFTGQGKIGRAAVVKAFGAFEQILAALVGGNASFDSCHKILSTKVRTVRNYENLEFSSSCCVRSFVYFVSS